MLKQKQLYNMIVCEFTNDTMLINDTIDKFRKGDLNIDDINFIMRNEFATFFENNTTFEFDIDIKYDLNLIIRTKLAQNLKSLFNLCCIDVVFEYDISTFDLNDNECQNTNLNDSFETNKNELLLLNEEYKQFN